MWENFKSIHDNHIKNFLFTININLQKIIKEKDEIIHEKEIEIYKKQTEIYKNIPIEKNITNNNTTINTSLDKWNGHLYFILFSTLKIILNFYTFNLYCPQLFKEFKY